jgi:hypothetical protein
MDRTRGRRRRAAVRISVLFASAGIAAACGDGGTPLTPSGGIVRSVGGTAELEGITATSSPQCPWGYGGTPPDCVPEGGWIPSGSSPGIGSFGSGDTSDGSGSGQTGDETRPEDGVAAFAVCVSAKMGPSGWLSVLATGISAWQLFEAREQVRDSYRAWELYHNGRSDNPNWDLATENLFWANFESAQSTETALWATTAAAALSTTAEIGKAIVACSPTLAIPEP